MKNLLDVMQEFQATAISAGFLVDKDYPSDDLNFQIVDPDRKWAIDVYSESNIHKDGHRIHAQSCIYPEIIRRKADPLRPMKWLQDSGSRYVWEMDIFCRMSRNSPTFKEYIDRSLIVIANRMRAHERKLLENEHLQQLCRKYCKDQVTADGDFIPDSTPYVVTPYGRGQLGIARNTENGISPRGVLRLGLDLPEQHIDAVLSLLHTLAQQDVKTEQDRLAQMPAEPMSIPAP